MSIKAAYPLTPFFDLAINGEPAPPKLLAIITQISVKEELMSANTITITFGSSDIAVNPGENAVRLVDDIRFVIGSRVTLTIGWVGGQKRVYSNYIYTNNRVEFSQNGIPTITNEAFNFTYFMNKESIAADKWPPDGYTGVKNVGELLKYICNKYAGVTLSIEGDQSIFKIAIPEPVYKAQGTTDIVWMQELADKYHFIFYSSDEDEMRILCTAPGPNDIGKTYEYRFGEYNLMSFSVSADARKTMALIAAMNLDPYSKAIATGNASAGEDNPLGDTPADSVLDGDPGSATVVIDGSGRRFTTPNVSGMQTDSESAGYRGAGPGEPGYSGGTAGWTNKSKYRGAGPGEPGYSGGTAGWTNTDPTKLTPEQQAALAAANAGFDVVSGDLAIAGGDPSIRVGMRINLQGLGTRYSGNYWAIGTTHTIGSRGYFTTASLMRNALDDSTHSSGSPSDPTGIKADIAPENDGTAPYSIYGDDGPPHSDTPGLPTNPRP